MDGDGNGRILYSTAMQKVRPPFTLLLLVPIIGTDASGQCS